jgi:4-diphosphocytidyl-2-C-methyl-D-erythritol kinase
MIIFPNAKINIGLNIISRREDGFHNIETVFYPIGLSDVMEVIPTTKYSECKLSISGIPIGGEKNDNLIIKAYHLLKSKGFSLPVLEIHLHKIIPHGAGLGGGSSDGASMLMLLKQMFGLNISLKDLLNWALELGSDCAFFLDNTPSFASGRGEVLESLSLSLKGYSLLVVKPAVYVSTAEAYRNCVPQKPEKSLNELINLPVESWKDMIYNDFEHSVFLNHPQIKVIKEELYQRGALYASMSGSGSSVYGIFKGIPSDRDFAEGCFTYKGLL